MDGAQALVTLDSFPTHVLRFCLCSTFLACRVCVLTFQGLGVDNSVMMELRVFQKKQEHAYAARAMPLERL